MNISRQTKSKKKSSTRKSQFRERSIQNNSRIHDLFLTFQFIERVPICPVILLTEPLYTLLCLLNVYVKFLKISFCLLRFPGGFLPKAGAKIGLVFLLCKQFSKKNQCFFQPFSSIYPKGKNYRQLSLEEKIFFFSNI